MSGGAFDYLSYRIEDAAEYIPDPTIKSLVVDVAILLHDLEWYESGDIGKAEYEERELAFHNKWLPTKKAQKEKRCEVCMFWNVEGESGKYGNCKFCKGYLTHRNEDACPHFEVKEN